MFPQTKSISARLREKNIIVLDHFFFVLLQNAMLDIMVKIAQNCAVIALKAKSVIMCLESVLKAASQGIEGLLVKKVNIYLQRCYQCDTFKKIYTVGY